jgi:alpha-galactosidase
VPDMSDIQRLCHDAEGLHVRIEISMEGDVRLLHCSAEPFDPLAPGLVHAPAFRLVEIQVAGQDWRAHHGNKYVGTSPGRHLRLTALRERDTAHGRLWEIEQTHAGLVITSYVQFIGGLPAMRCWTEVRNAGTTTETIEYVSSFVLGGLGKGSRTPSREKLHVHTPHNAWYGEAQWQRHSMADLGLEPWNACGVLKAGFSSQGSWSSAGRLPLGCIENSESGTALGFQIEHNGSWHWEISDHGDGQYYLAAGGPTERESHWSVTLAPGEAFTSVPVGVAVAMGGLEATLAELTRYRRRIMRPCEDNRRLPVIFNDYMNCLTGDPTTEKLEPLIDAAAAAGCEYFCIDCGWYSDGPWWDGVGEWLPSTARFPGGITVPLRRIRERGMIPGLWLELEVMGTQCRLAQLVPDDWFFLRHGRRVIDHGRYQLDYRNPAVRAHADAVIDRLVGWGVGYIKMDYNINAGPGTEAAATSLGGGLLAHNRAYLAWLDGVFARHPALVIENCGSGGMRMDYALLARHSIQSTTDQTDYRKMAAIAAAVVSACTPEQAATWSYPLRDGDEEEVVFNMVNAMTMRIHQSGHLADLSDPRRALVAEGIATYKGYRQRIPEALPIWPLGLPRLGDGWMAFGLDLPDRTLLAVWRLDAGQEGLDIPLPRLAGRRRVARILYPSGRSGSCSWEAASGHLAVLLPTFHTARLIDLV